MLVEGEGRRPRWFISCSAGAMVGLGRGWSVGSEGAAKDKQGRCRGQLVAGGW